MVDIDIVNLPLEERSFFIMIPYTCICCYDVFKYFLKRNFNMPFPVHTYYVVRLALIMISLFNLKKVYTRWTGISAGLLLMTTAYTNPHRLASFWRMYIMIVIPFLLVNGALTRGFTPEPVVWYNNEENLAIRAGTMPVEDFAYNLLLLLGNTNIYEYVGSKYSDWMDFFKTKSAHVGR